MGLRDSGIVTGFGNAADDIPGVLIQRVIHAGLFVCLRTVVVHTQPASNVQIPQTGSSLPQVAVHARCFDHR